MFMTIALFNDSFIVVMSVSFTCLIVIEMLNILSMVHVYKSLMFTSIVVSVVTYIVSIYTFTGLFQI